MQEACAYFYQGVLEMKFRLFLTVIIFYFIRHGVGTFAYSAEDPKQLVEINITRLEALRADCLIKNSGNQRLCRRKVLKQCSSTMKKSDCRLLMSKMSKGHIPKTNGPSPLQETSF